jgi:hypothetical protein
MKQPLKRLALVLPAALTLIACGGGSEPATTTTPTPTADPAPAATDPAPVAPMADSGEQTFAQALEVFCAAPSKSGVNDAVAEEKATVLATWIQANATNAEFLQFMADMASVAPADRAGRMNEKLAAEGITDCEMMTFMEAQQTGATP